MAMANPARASSSRFVPPRTCTKLPGSSIGTERPAGKAMAAAMMAGASPTFLSAENLLEKAWDENADPFTNTVVVTIGRLRRKLGDPPIITTIPGAGYRIADPSHQPSP